MRKLAVVAVLGLVLVSTGCVGRAISEGVGSVTGAKGVAADISPTPPDVTPYQRFELGAFTDDMGGKVPPELFQLLPPKFAEQVREKKLPDVAGGKTLVATGKVVYYESAGMAGQLFGPFEEVVARVQFTDKESGKVVGEAYCIGRSTQSVNKGVPEKADGLAKGIVSWITAHRKG